MAPNSRSSGKIKQGTFWLSFLTILVIVLAACGGSNSTTQLKRQALEGLQQIMVEQLPSIPLTAEPYWYEYSTAKFVGWPDAQHPYAAPGTAEYPDIEIVLLNLQPAQ